MSSLMDRQWDECGVQIRWTADQMQEYIDMDRWMDVWMKGIKWMDICLDVMNGYAGLMD